MRPTHTTKTIIARIWLTLAVVAAIYALTHLGHSSAHRAYHLQAVQYDTKIKLFHHMEDEKVIQSFVEGDDPGAYTYLGSHYIGMYPYTDFALFRPWISSSGVSQISPIYNPSTQTLLTQSELIELVLAEAALSLKSPDPLWEFEQMQSRGFLILIANNPTPITKFHPANIAADLLTIAIFAGAIWSVAHLIKRKVQSMAADDTARCPTCSYPRTGLASITQCPECGHHFTISTTENLN